MAKKRKVPQINGSSSADIAFMLLLFFLLTTSMDTDQGLARQLPRPPENREKKDDVEFNKRNVLQVMINSSNQILCSGEEVSLPILKEKAKEFIDNPTNSVNLPEKTTVNIQYFGDVAITEGHLISLQCDRGTNYQTYIDVQNELAKAYNELRDDLSRKQFTRVFAALNEDEKAAVMKYYKQGISEAEPQTYGDKKKK
jgi:Biopolymer transport protein